MRDVKYLHRSVFVIVRFLLSTMILLILVGCMNSLFYFPNQKDYESGPKQHSQVYSDHYWQTADGVTLHGWLIPAQREGTLMEEAMGTVLFAHGNAANITTHYWLLSWMPKAGINVFIFDYRGFGQSKGRSTFKGTELDAISALHYLKSLEEIDPDKIIALGQSLGAIA